MKNKDKIYALFSGKIKEKRRRKAEVANENSKLGPSVPASANNFVVNNPLFGPHRIKKNDVAVIQKKIGPNEGLSTVNSKTASSDLIHKPRGKAIPDPTSGAIVDIPNPNKKKTRGRGRKKDV